VIFFAHGAQKVFGWFGGLAMIVGLLVRPAAVGLILVMLVAIAKVHWPNGFFINWASAPGRGHGFEMNLALIGMALAVLVGGAGALSVDRWLRPW
jgi:putative oxidoreductase